MEHFGAIDFLVGLFYLILIAAGVGLLISIPTFLLASTIGLGAKLFGKTDTTDPGLNDDLVEINKDFEKTMKEYNVTNDAVRDKIFNELLAKKNIEYDNKSKKFTRRT